MKKMFNYTKFNNERQDNLVESFMALADAYCSGKQNTAEYKEANKQFNYDLMEECVSAIPNAEFTGLDMIKNPQVHNDMFFTHRFDTIMAGMITPIIPQVLADAAYDDLYEVTQVGWGVA